MKVARQQVIEQCVGIRKLTISCFIGLRIVYRSGLVNQEDGSSLQGYVALTKNFLCWHNSPMTEDSFTVTAGYRSATDKAIHTSVAFKDVTELDEEYNGTKGHIVIQTQSTKVRSLLLSIWTERGYF